MSPPASVARADPGLPARADGPRARPRPHWSLRLLASWVVFNLVLGIGGPLLQCLVWVLHPANIRPPTALARDARAVSFETRDGYTLRGHWAPPAPDRPVLIFTHGIGNSRDSQLDWAQLFHRAGYGALAFDWRAHGESDGWIITFGRDAASDLLAALDFLESEAPDRPVGIVSQSIGAACTAQAAAKLPAQVRCLVLDSPFGDLSRMVDDRLAWFGPLAALARPLIPWTFHLLTGASPAELAPERALAAFHPRPVFVLHGEEDEVIPVSEGRRVHALYPGPKVLWVAPGEEHVSARWRRLEEWMGRTSGFLAAHLEGAPSREQVMAHVPRLRVDG